MSNFRLLEKEEKENLLKIDRDMIEIQKTIIYFGEQILKELNDIKEIIKGKTTNKNLVVEKEINKAEQQILKHLEKMEIPYGYKGNNLKW